MEASVVLAILWPILLGVFLVFALVLVAGEFFAATDEVTTEL